MNRFDTYDMMRHLDFGQVAIKVSGNEGFVDGHEMIKAGNGVYYDRETAVLQEWETKTPVYIFKSSSDFEWVIVDEDHLKQYNLGKGVYKQYKKSVKWNENATYEVVQKKLSRNIALAIRVDLDEQYPNEDRKLYLYGNLHIVTKGDTIVSIKNHTGKCDWFYKDENKYKLLNTIHGIEGE